MKKFLTLAFLIITSLLVINVEKIQFSSGGKKVSNDSYLIDDFSRETASNGITDIKTMEILGASNLSSPIVCTYGDEIILEAGEELNTTYVWTINNVVQASNNSILDCSSFDAGVYEIVCSKTTADDTENIEYNLIINKAPYNFIFPESREVNYFLFDKYSFLNNNQIDDIESKYYKKSAGSTEETNTFDIGEYCVKINLIEELDKNYQLEIDEFNFSIVPAELDVVWDEKNDFSYTGETIAPTYTLEGQKYGYNVEVVLSGDSVIKATEVGEYSIKIEGLSSKYFTLSKDTVATFNWSISPIGLEVRWDTIDFSYSGHNNYPIAYGYADDIEILLDVKEVSTGSTEFINVDDYAVEAFVPSGYTGFTLVGNSTGVCSVTPRKLDIRYTGDSNYIYNGQLITIGVEITSIIDDEVTLTLSGYEYKDAGEYVARVIEVSDSNYYVDETDIFEWKISPKVIDVIWDEVLVFEFDGTLNWPVANAETGIDGENVSITVEGELNVHSNEGSSGYIAEASLGEEFSNYKLTDSTTKVRYWIIRTSPFFNVREKASKVYTGGKLLPEYDFTGEEGSLIIKVDGLEIVGGITNPGVYELVFTSKQTQDYNPIQERRCTFTIHPTNLNASVEESGLNISAFNADGFRIQQLDISMMDDFDKESIKSITKFEGYKYNSAINIGSGNYTISKETELSFKLNKIDGDRLRIFFINSDGSFTEKEVVVKDNVATIKGGVGQYLLLVKKLNWWQKTSVVTALSVTVFIIICAGIAIFVFVKPKLMMQESAIYRETKKRLTKKVENGEKITDELIEGTRAEVVKEREKYLKEKQAKKLQKKSSLNGKETAKQRNKSSKQKSEKTKEKTDEEK